LALYELAHDSVEWSGPQWVGSHAPFWDRGGFPSIDSTDDDSVSMSFTTEPLTHPIEILGTPVVSVMVTTDRPFGLVAARLVAVDPRGVGHLICRASRNLTFPGDLSEPVTPTPGEPIDLRFGLRVTSAVIPAGWRLRLALAGADFPVVWPPRDRFALTVDPARSSLTLPLIRDPSGDRRVDIPMAPDPPTAPVDSLRDLSEWDISTADDTHTLRRARASSDHLPERNDLTYDSDQWWTVTVDDDDPASMHVRTEASVALRRPGWSIETHGSIEISGGPAFEIEVELVAVHDSTEIFRRRWAETIPRIWA
jgi:hypothetical protein